MLRTETLIDAYIDANLIFVFAFLAWCCVRMFVRRTRLRHDYGVQLRLTEGMMLATLISPALAIACVWCHAWMFPGTSMNASDLVLNQFLNGRIPVDAQQFQAMMGLRAQVVEGLADPKSLAAQILIGLFVIGFALSVARVGQSARQLHRLIGRSFVWRRFGRLDILVSEEVCVPFSTRGLRRRYIVCPMDMLGRPRELKIALAHELQHMRRKDTEWELALVLISPLFFWNPVFAFWKRQIEHLRELACDQALLDRQSVNPRHYADCLLAVCDRNLNAGQTMAPQVPLLATGQGAIGRRNRTVLATRIAAIAHKSTPSRCPAFVIHCGVLLAAVVLAFGAASLRQPADWSQDRLMLSTIVNLERLESRNSGLSLQGF